MRILSGSPRWAGPCGAALRVVAGTLLLAGAALAQRNEPGKLGLSKSDTTALDALIALDRGGRMIEVFEKIQPILQSSTPAQVRAFDAYLKNHGIDTPMVTLSVDGRLQGVLHGQKAISPKATDAEVPIILKKFTQETDRIVTEVVDTLKVGPRVNMPAELRDQMIEYLPLLIDSTEVADRLLAHLAEVMAGVPAANIDLMERDVQLLANRDYAAERLALPPRRDELLERLVDLNVARIEFELDRFLDDTTDFQRRFRAGVRLGDSFAILADRWDAYTRRKHRSPSSPKPDDLEKTWKRQQQRFHDTSLVFRRKIYHFERARQWWLRGRFGIGNAQGGFAKAIPPNTRNLEQTLLYYPLWMPARLEKPPDPVAKPLAAFPERRFMEWWRNEIQIPNARASSLLARVNRQLVKAVLGKIEDEGVPTVLDTRSSNAHLVGYVEYQMALFHFETLLGLCTAAEVRAIDEMLGDDDRFVVYSNLSRIYDALDPRSTLIQSPPQQDARADSRYERRGLPWVLGLARIEISAMLAPDWRNAARSRISSPFDFWPATKFEEPAYSELLGDGGRVMYYAVRTEVSDDIPVQFLRDGRVIFGDQLGGNDLTGPPVVAGQGPLEQGLRIPWVMLKTRLAITSELLQAFANHQVRQLSNSQKQELQAWLAWTAGLQRLFRDSLDLANDRFTRPRGRRTGADQTGIPGDNVQSPAPPKGANRP